MPQLRRFIRVLLIVLAGILGLSAVPGGLMLLVGFYAPPIADLKGSLFADFTIPALALLLLVGGSALLTTVLLVRRNRFGLLTAILAGAIIMAFEFVEVLSIGSPKGPARVMQLLYFGIGLSLIGLSLSAMVIDARWLRGAD